MKNLSGTVKGVSSILDKLAGISLFAVMLLIVANIMLRTVFERPILGTYELVGFLTGLGVALALAHCAFQDGHIAVSFILERFPRKIQSAAAVLINAASLGFWLAAVWFLGRFGHTMMIKGLVSPSAEIPVYPFIYLIAFGMLGLCFVLMLKFWESFREVLGIDPAKKVAQ